MCSLSYQIDIFTIVSNINDHVIKNEHRNIDSNEAHIIFLEKNNNNNEQTINYLLTR